MVELRAGERILRAGFAKAQSHAAPERRQTAQGVGVEAEVVADLTGTGAAVAQVNGPPSVGGPGHDPRGWAHAPAAVFDIDHVRVDRAVLTAGATDFVSDTELGRGTRADQYRVVPGEFRQRLG